MFKRIKPYVALMIIIVYISLFSVGCGIGIGYSSSSSAKSMNASFSSLSDTIKKNIEVKSGDILSVDYNIDLKSGTLDAKLQDLSGNEIMRFDVNSQGRNQEKFDRDGAYNIIIKADKAKGSYKFEWTIK